MSIQKCYNMKPGVGLEPTLSGHEPRCYIDTIPARIKNKNN
jgi:hypothetical protein